jgi:hypothetical protein
LLDDILIAFLIITKIGPKIQKYLPKLKRLDYYGN